MSTAPRREDCWTRRPPERCGFYWWRQGIEWHGDVFPVYEIEGELFVFTFLRHFPVAEFGGEWFGPLVEPGGAAIEDCDDDLVQNISDK